MAYEFFNIKLNEKKEFKISIQKIFGIGLNTSYKLNKILGINNRKLLSLENLSIFQINIIKIYLPDITIFDSDLKRLILNEREKFFELKCYKRNRFLLNLPTRGQRTRTNAKTVRKIKNI